MARVPIVQGQVTSSGLAPTGFQAVRRPGTAMVGEALRRAGASLGEISEELDRLDEARDTAWTLQQDNQGAAAIRERVQTGENAFLRLRGLNASDEEMEAARDDVRRVLQSGLEDAPSPRARAMYERVMERRLTQADTLMGEHAFREVTAARDTARDARIVNAEADLTAAGPDRAAQEPFRAIIDAELTARVQERGLDPVLARTERDRIFTRSHLAIATGLAASDPTASLRYIHGNSGEILDSEEQAARARLFIPVLEQIAQRIDEDQVAGRAVPDYWGEVQDLFPNVAVDGVHGDAAGGSMVMPLESVATRPTDSSAALTSNLTGVSASDLIPNASAPGSPRNEGAQPERFQHNGFEIADGYGAPRSGGRLHGGLDMAAPRGTAFRFGRGIRVISSNVARDGKMGNMAIIEFPDGTQWAAGHLPDLPRPGEYAAGAEVIRSGSTGNASASWPHIHIRPHNDAARSIYNRGRRVTAAYLTATGGEVPQRRVSADPVGTFLQRMQGHESGGQNIRNQEGSSAAGPGQYMPDTWRTHYRRAYPDTRLTDAQIEARRLAPSREENQAVQRASAEGYANDLRQAGLPVTAGNLYMLHHFGEGQRGGGISILRAPRSRLLKDILPNWDGPNGVNAQNSHLDNTTTAGDIADELAERMGETAGPGAAPAGGTEGPSSEQIARWARTVRGPPELQRMVERNALQRGAQRRAEIQQARDDQRTAAERTILNLGGTDNLRSTSQIPNFSQLDPSVQLQYQGIIANNVERERREAEAARNAGPRDTDWLFYDQLRSMPTSQLRQVPIDQIHARIAPSERAHILNLRAGEGTSERNRGIERETVRNTVNPVLQFLGVLQPPGGNTPQAQAERTRVLQLREQLVDFVQADVERFRSANGGQMPNRDQIENFAERAAMVVSDPYVGAIRSYFFQVPENGVRIRYSVPPTARARIIRMYRQERQRRNLPVRDPNEREIEDFFMAGRGTR